MRRRFLSILLALASSSTVASALAAEGEADAPITKLPVLKENAEAVYPGAALRDRIEAKVVLQLDIDTSGRVADALVVASSTTAEDAATVATSTIADYGFVRAAKRAARALVFEPAEAGGKPVPVRITYTINFELPAPKVPEEARTSSTSTGAVERETLRVEGEGRENFLGVVRERGTRRLLAGVVVTVYREEGGKESGFEAITDKQGRFKFVDLEPGDWKVLAEAEGFFPFRTEETMREGEAVEVTYYLERGSYNRYDIRVEAVREKKEVNRRTLRIEEIVKVPGTLNDPVLVVENLPGVARAGFGAGQFVVRGSETKDSSQLIEGVDVPLIFHFGGLRSVIPPEMVSGLDFYPGNYPVSYGGATGGILDVHTKHPHPDQLHGSLDVSLLEAALYLEFPIGSDVAIAIGGRRSYADAILKAAIPSDASLSFSTFPRYYDGQIMAQWKPSNEHELRLFYFGSNDKLSLLFKNPTDVDVQITSGGLSAATVFDRVFLEHTFTPSAQFRNLARATVGRDDISARLVGLFRFDISDITLQARDIASYAFTDAFTLSGGIDTVYYLSNVSIRAPRPPREGDPVFNQNLNDQISTDLNKAVIFSFAPFVDAQIKPIEHLTVVPSLRLDYFHPVNKVSLDPRLVVRYELSGEWLAKAGVGLYHQAPQPDETDKSFGNPDLGLIRAIHYAAGAEFRPTKYLSFDGTLFYKDLSNIVSRSDATTMRDGMIVPVVYDNSGSGRVFGFELYVRHELTNNLQGQLSYTLSRSERKDAAAADYRIFQFDQTHILNMIVTYFFPENWSAGIRLRIISGNPSTPFVGGVFLSDFDRYSPIPAPVYSSRLPLFHQLDIRIDKSWIYDAWRLSAYFSLYNAYNHGSVEGIVYNYNYTEQKTQTGIPILPIIGLKAEL
jgi:TonB family protein